MGYLKGKSSLMIFQKFGNMKFAYRNREFWCKGYYVDTVGKNTKAIEEYIAHQLKVDKEIEIGLCPKTKNEAMPKIAESKLDPIYRSA